ncbi:MAG: hypothetical protein M1827_001176 [Pycnora praestabilis]|nr:MAG: hypothetical protein M1827_001176 [Pycnora praestabilis]
MHLSSLLKRSKPGQSGAIENNEKKAEKPLKHKLFSRLLKASSNRSEHQVDQRASPGRVAPPPVSTIVVPSPSNTEKPLPPPPSSVSAVEIEDSSDHPASSLSDTAIQVPEKSFQSLKADDIRLLFSGAPQFTIQTVHHGRPQPSVSFPWDAALNIRDVSDCPRLGHPAFSASTLRDHFIEYDEVYNHESRAVDETENAHKAVFDTRIHETPSMLSAQGIEPGSVGFETFLELPVADVLHIADTDTTEAGKKERTSQLRKKICEEPDGGKKIGVRHVRTSRILERLRTLGELQHESGGERQAGTILGKHSEVDLYVDLFTRLLHPPTNVTEADAKDPYSLKVQIEALMEALAQESLWIDFSLVEWRIRLGQVIWGISDQIQDESVPMDNGAEGADAEFERQWLLLQILLSCELLVRLNAVVKLAIVEKSSSLGVTRSEIRHFKKMRTTTIDWDLVLARRFLENIRILQHKPNAEPQTPMSPESKSSHHSSWFSFSLPGSSMPTRRDSFEHQRQQHQQLHEEGLDTSCMLPRHQSRQLSGLLHFARAIAWPDIDNIITQITEKISSPSAFPTPVSSIYGTPIATPLSYSSARSSYFNSARPRLDRGNTRRSMFSQRASYNLEHNLGTGGWLSKSWLSGLVLPGEAISHLLISTLLENDLAAIEHLGENANLFGGFVYQQRSWWSKSCIVGRVLACLEGSRECSGWISCAVVPDGFGEGWLDVEAKVLPNPKTPRILGGKDVSVKSGLFGSEMQKGDILPQDFTLPVDEDFPVRHLLDIQLQGLSLMAVDRMKEDVGSIDNEGDFRIYDASVIFSAYSPQASEQGECLSTKSVAYNLSHEVNFISSFPCHPPHRPSIHHHPSTGGLDCPPSHQAGGHHEHLHCHLLHNSYTYVKISLDQLLDNPTAPAVGPVWIVNAIGSRDAEALARAWCAKHGQNAIIGRRGRTCISCCIREASALDVHIVIRV